MMAKIFVVGRIKRAAQVVGGKNGGKEFMACTVEVVRESGGKSYTDYYSVNCYRFDAALVDSITEGVMAVAEGIPGVNQYESQGKHRANVKIIGSVLPLTGKPKASQPAAEYDPERPPV